MNRTLTRAHANYSRESVMAQRSTCTLKPCIKCICSIPRLPNGAETILVNFLYDCEGLVHASLLRLDAAAKNQPRTAAFSLPDTTCTYLYM